MVRVGDDLFSGGYEACQEVGGALAPPPAFLIESITSTVENKSQTDNFGGKMGVQLPATSVKNPIVIRGTYTPANDLIVASILVSPLDDGSYTPELNNGVWTVTIPEETLKANKKYEVGVYVRGSNDAHTAIVNGTKVSVLAQTFNVLK